MTKLFIVDVLEENTDADLPVVVPNLLDDLADFDFLDLDIMDGFFRAELERRNRWPRPLELVEGCYGRS